MISPAGLRIAETIHIDSPERLADVLREANDSDKPVLPVGGGVCIGTGIPTEHEYLALDLTGMSGVLEYVSTDMTAGFLAGTSVSEVREALAENGQELPIDFATDDAGTIGGLVSTGFASARRYSQGTLKDLLIGSEYVRGDGLIAKAGGMTVKNVSGFEISRLLHGSWGSLAVITRVNLKVLPKPRADRSLTWIDSELTAAVDRQIRLLNEFPGATALQTSGANGEWRTSIRFTGRESGVNSYVEQVTNSEGEPEVADTGITTWVTKQSTAEDAQLVLSDQVEQLRSSLTTLNASEGISGMTWSFNTGTLRADIVQDAFDSGALSSRLWMIEGGSEGFRSASPVWGPVRADQSIMQSVKQQFDPNGVLNRGRLFV